MKRLITFSFLFFVLSYAGWSGFIWFQERQHYESTDNAYLKANSVLITPKVSGYISQLRIDDNQAVQKGEIVAVIEAQDYQAKVDLAAAKVNELQAEISRLQATKNMQHAHVATANADVSAIQARQNNVEKDLQRFTRLVESGAAPAQMLDKILSQSRETAAQLQGSKSSVAAQSKQLFSYDHEIDAAQARLKQAQAQLELAKIDLENINIRAPFDGVIGHRGVQLGAFVQAGTHLAYLLETQKVWIEANFKETQITNMKVGQLAKIHVDAFPEIEFTGKVDSFSPASGADFSILPAENATGNFTKIVRRVPVKIIFDKNEHTKLLKSGLSTTVKVQVQPL